MLNRRQGLFDKTLSAADRAIQRAGRSAAECAGGSASGKRAWRVGLGVDPNDEFTRSS